MKSPKFLVRVSLGDLDGLDLWITLVTDSIKIRYRRVKIS